MRGTFINHCLTNINLVLVIKSFITSKKGVLLGGKCCNMLMLCFFNEIKEEMEGKESVQN